MYKHRRYVKGVITLQNYQYYNLEQLLGILWKKIWIVILISLFFCFIAFIFTYYCIEPKYTATIKLFVNNYTEINTDITSSDVTASQALVATYITIIQSDTVLDKVIAKTGINYTTQDIKKMMSAGALNDTEVFNVSITSIKPEEASHIANAIADIAPSQIAEIVSGSSVKIVDRAKIPIKPTSPNYLLNIVLGFLFGGLTSSAIILLVALKDQKVKTESDLKNISKLPLLGTITEFNFTAKRYTKGKAIYETQQTAPQERSL